MTPRERLSHAIVYMLGTLAVACVVGVVLVPDGRPGIATALALIAGTCAGALGGALNIPPAHRGHDNGPHPQPPPDTTDGVPPR